MQDPNNLPQNIRLWGMFCHLASLFGVLAGNTVTFPFVWVLVPFAVWQLGRDRHPFVDTQGRSAVNFSLSMALYGFVVSILWVLLALAVCGTMFMGANTNSQIFNNVFGWLVYGGLALWVVFIIFQLVVTGFAAVKAYQGQVYRYPWTLRFLRDEDVE